MYKNTYELAFDEVPLYVSLVLLLPASSTDLAE